HVDVGKQRAQTADAPTITGLPKSLPVIDGVAPKLSLRAEVIGRHTGNEARPALLVQQKQLRISPNVARVGRDEEGQVADQAQTLAVGVRLEPLALAEQQELREAHLADLIRQFAPNPVERRRFAPDQLCRPFEVIYVVELRL